MAQANIWIHALLAMLFAGVALASARNVDPVAPRRALAAALGLTALWALAVAGIGGNDVASHIAGGALGLGWLAVLFALTQPRRWRGVAFVSTALAILLATGLRVVAELARDGLAGAVLANAASALAMLAAAAALVLAGRSRLDGGARGGRQLLLGALTVMWSAELLLGSLAWADVGSAAARGLARGLIFGGVGALAALAVHRGGEWVLRPSRTLALRTIALAAGIATLTFVAGLSGSIGALGGAQARLVQTAVVIGGGVSLLTLAATPWLRAWARVVVAKHLFSHRYDYRVAWMRFNATLAAIDEGERPLDERVLRALAELSGSPAALLLVACEDGLEPRASWHWDMAAANGPAALSAYLAATRRIVALDEIRRGTAPAGEIAVVPAWLAASGGAWALVPLIHGQQLVGAVVLARPLVDRTLDWEDFDVLGIAARQVAGDLAEEAARAALAEARRFEEFNRRFAFLLHDLKNLVSQMALVARNAERHADNPDFRADMIATLRDTSQRMTAILARLSHQPPATTSEPARPVALRALAERIADARRAQHPLVVEGEESWAMVPSAALETALTHLVQNAIEASPAGAAVTLAIGDGTIAIVDRGAGMAPAFVRDGLFTPFVSGKANGFGLGAHEARTLIAAMDGRLEVESREGAGTRFRIVLPAPTAMEEAA